MELKLNNKKPNIIIFTTDQQREIRDFPPEWVAENLKSLVRLQRNGMTYRHNYINTAPCWANRGVMMSGVYPLVSQVLEVGDTLPPSLASFPKILKKAGYRRIYKGKWHLTGKFDHFSTGRASVTDGKTKPRVIEEDKEMEALYGFSGWTSPDAGTSLVDTPNPNAVATLGGGKGNNDNRVVHGKDFLAPEYQESAVDFIKNHADSDEPYCLVVSLVNPHDISVYPGDLEAYGYCLDAIKDYKGFQLPVSYHEDNLSTKPHAQLNLLNGFGSGPMDEETALNYLKFYAYLQTLPDKLIGDVLDAMTPQQLEETIIIRTADHGEMGAAHGGLREKANTFYQETVNIPLIISNPILFPEPKTCDQLVGQIDLVPTIADLVGLDAQAIQEEFLLQGTSFAQTLVDPDAYTNDDLIFLYYSGANFTTVHPSGAANVICGYLNKRWKYAVYFAPQGGSPKGEHYAGVISGNTFPVNGGGESTSIFTSNWYPVVMLDSVQYELYDREHDPHELNNLLYGETIPAEIKKVHKTLHHQLTQKMMENNSLPIGWRDIVV